MSIAHFHDWHSCELHLLCFFLTVLGDGELADKAALRAAALGRLPSAPVMPAYKRNEMIMLTAHSMQLSIVQVIFVRWASTCCTQGYSPGRNATFDLERAEVQLWMSHLSSFWTTMQLCSRCHHHKQSGLHAYNACMHTMHTNRRYRESLARSCILSAGCPGLL